MFRWHYLLLNSVLWNQAWRCSQTKISDCFFSLTKLTFFPLSYVCTTEDGILWKEHIEGHHWQRIIWRHQSALEAFPRNFRWVSLHPWKGQQVWQLQPVSYIYAVTCSILFHPILFILNFSFYVIVFIGGAYSCSYYSVVGFWHIFSSTLILQWIASDFFLLSYKIASS